MLWFIWWRRQSSWLECLFMTFMAILMKRRTKVFCFWWFCVISIKMTIAECPGRGHNSLGNQSGESRDVRLDRYIMNIIIIEIIIILITIMFKVGLYVYFYIAVVACLSVFWVLTQNFWDRWSSKNVQIWSSQKSKYDHRRNPNTQRPPSGLLTISPYSPPQ